MSYCTLKLNEEKLKYGGGWVRKMVLTQHNCTVYTEWLVKDVVAMLWDLQAGKSVINMI